MTPAPATLLTGKRVTSLSASFGRGWTSALDAHVEVVAGPGHQWVTVRTETGLPLVFVSGDGGLSFDQVQPTAGPRHGFTHAGGEYVLALFGDPYRRTFDDATGWMTKLTEVATGRSYTITRQTSSVTVTDSVRGTVDSPPVVTWTDAPVRT